MADRRDTLLAIARICHRLGGRLIILTQRELNALMDEDHNDDLSHPGTVKSRFEYAIHWKKKIIYAVRGTRQIGFLIHEAGHVFADPHPPDHDKCDEWAWLGWEIAVARQIGAWNTWSRQNARYHMGNGLEDGVNNGIGKGKDWYDLSTRERHAIITDRLAYAKKIGILSKRGTPRSVR